MRISRTLPPYLRDPMVIQLLHAAVGVGRGLCPGTLLVTSLIGRLGGFGAVFQRDYSSLLTCTSMAWAAANFPVVVAAWGRRSRFLRE